METHRPGADGRSGEKGFSVLEMVIVTAVILIISAAAVPQLPAMRRLHRAAAIPIQVKTKMRLARQQAMAQRRAVTFQYDDQSKQISIITHQTAGSAVLTAANYPDTAGSTKSNRFALTGDGLKAADLIYGPPASVAGTFDDSTALSPLAGGGQVNITFQPDGSVINAAGLPINFALVFHTAQAPTDTAYAISILGSSGRVKVWRYSSNVSKFVE